jgi:hypothetical protein
MLTQYRQLPLSSKWPRHQQSTTTLAASPRNHKLTPPAQWVRRRFAFGIERSRRNAVLRWCCSVGEVETWGAGGEGAGRHLKRRPLPQWTSPRCPPSGMMLRAPVRAAALGPLLTFDHRAANGRPEPNVRDAARRSNGWFQGQSTNLCKNFKPDAGDSFDRILTEGDPLPRIGAHAIEKALHLNCIFTSKGDGRKHSTRQRGIAHFDFPDT